MFFHGLLKANAFAPQDWDKYLNIRGALNPAFSLEYLIYSQTAVTGPRDGDDNDSEKPISSEGTKGAAQAETIQQDTHTLDEYHEHLLSASFDMSFNGRGVEPSSSQVEQGFDFNDNFFALSDEIDIGQGLGDELAKELGWSFSPVKAAQV